MATLTGTLEAVGETESGAAGTAVQRPVTQPSAGVTQSYQIIPSVFRLFSLASVGETESGAALAVIPLAVTLASVGETESGAAEPSVLRTATLTATATSESGAALLAMLVATTFEAVGETDSNDDLRVEIITGLLRLIVTASRPSIRVG